MKNCFYATFWTISGQNWPLPVTWGYFRYLTVSVTSTQGTCSWYSHWCKWLTPPECGPNTIQIDKKLLKVGFWAHFRSKWNPWLDNTWSLSWPWVILQFWYPASWSYKASLPVKMETSGMKVHKNVHFRSRGWSGVNWTHVIGSLSKCLTKLQQGADTLNLRLHYKN